MKSRQRPSTGSRQLTLIGASLANVIVILDVTVVNVSVNAMRTSLGATVAGLQWIVSAYTLVFAALLLSGGALSDRYGARRIFVAGIAIFTVASGLCGLAATVEMLVLGRAMQGIGAALCVPASLALLSHIFPDRIDRAKAISIWGGIGGIALAAGPIVGGIVVQFLGWQSIFFINIPTGMAAIWLVRREVSSSGEEGPRGVDVGGQILAVPALAGITFACIESGSKGWGSTQVMTGALCSAIALPLFVLVERRQKYPMLPLDIFQSPTVAVGTFVGFVMNFCYYGFLFALSLFLQSEKGYSPLVTGLTFLPMTLLAVFANLAAGRWIGRTGPRPALLVGMVVALIGYLALMICDERTPYAWMVVPMVAIGVGGALSLPAFTVAVVEHVLPERRGIASGVLNMARQTGGVLGVGVFGSLISAFPFMSGLRIALLVSAGLVAVGAAFARSTIGRTSMTEAPPPSPI